MRPRFFAWLMSFGSRGVRVTSPKRIDGEGLGKRLTETEQICKV